MLSRVDIDNLRAVKQNQSIIHRSDLDALLPVYRSLEEMIAAAVAARGGAAGVATAQNQ